MKVVLTESQYKYVLTEERLAYILQESLNESKTFKDLMAKIKQALVAGVAASVLITAVNKLNIPSAEKDQLIDTIEQNDSTETNDDDYMERVKACEDYMKMALGNQGFSLESTQLKPETLVSVADKNDFDLPFLMAAAHLESCFGAAPRAQRTNSVFSVGCYDSGKNAVTYADPNDSVEAYVNLLNNHYLIGGKTIFDLMKPGNFVNELGKRYASNKEYEGKIRSVRNSILKKFPILGN